MQLASTTVSVDWPAVCCAPHITSIPTPLAYGFGGVASLIVACSPVRLLHTNTYAHAPCIYTCVATYEVSAEQCFVLGLGYTCIVLCAMSTEYVFVHRPGLRRKLSMARPTGSYEPLRQEEKKLCSCVCVELGIANCGFLISDECRQLEFEW